MKKMIAFILAFMTTCFTIMPMATTVSAAAGISLNKAVYLPREDIVVKISGITEKMYKEMAWLKICTAGAGHDEFDYDYANLEKGADTYTLAAPGVDGEYEVLFYKNASSTEASLAASAKFTVLADQWEKASDWFIDELREAAGLGLIPGCLKEQDLTKSITRAEFAAVSVRLYENFSGAKTEPVTVNPFKDTKDTEVLKAYHLGVTNGYNDKGDLFGPDMFLSREQAATMLARVCKKYFIPGWTLASDNNFKLEYVKPAPFKDDDKISEWAKDSVYFMAANKIILGDAGNFKPRNTTGAEEAAGYANMTREAALALAVRAAVNLKGKTLDYTGGEPGKLTAGIFKTMGGGSLKGIRSVLDGKTTDLEILAFDQDAPDKVFEIPEDYIIF